MKWLSLKIKERERARGKKKWDELGVKKKKENFKSRFMS